MFHNVQLRQGDRLRELEKLGLRSKSRRGVQEIRQPCPAHTGASCRVYADRPTRCREFRCAQLLAIEAGTASEGDAAQKILEASALVAEVERLLRSLGEDRAHRALSTRFASVFTPPLAGGSEAEPLRNELSAAMQCLQNLLQSDFYPPQTETRRDFA
jgi:hypothetical protein